MHVTMRNVRRCSRCKRTKNDDRWLLICCNIVRDVKGRKMMTDDYLCGHQVVDTRYMLSLNYLFDLSVPARFSGLISVFSWNTINWDISLNNNKGKEKCNTFWFLCPWWTKIANCMKKSTDWTVCCAHFRVMLWLWKTISVCNFYK